MDEQQLPDLLRLRGSVVTASDEFFAAKENLIRPDAPVFVPETYDAKGQVYDGWETRRQRGPDGTLPERGARDWVIVRLGVPGVVRSIVLDTAFFTGNYPQACSADACSAPGQAAARHPAPVPGGRRAGHARPAEHLSRRWRGPVAPVRIPRRGRPGRPPPALGRDRLTASAVTG